MFDLCSEEICCGLCSELDPDFCCIPSVTSLKTNHLFLAVNSWTTKAVVSGCSSGHGQGWEYERNEANNICGELGAQTIFTHTVCSVANLCRRQAWLMVCRFWKFTKKEVALLVQQSEWSFQLNCLTSTSLEVCYGFNFLPSLFQLQ